MEKGKERDGPGRWGGGLGHLVPAVSTHTRGFLGTRDCGDITVPSCSGSRKRRGAEGPVGNQEAKPGRGVPEGPGLWVSAPLCHPILWSGSRGAEVGDTDPTPMGDQSAEHPHPCCGPTGTQKPPKWSWEGHFHPRAEPSSSMLVKHADSPNQHTFAQLEFCPCLTGCVGG